jgi:hypothetical protein
MLFPFVPWIHSPSHRPRNAPSPAQPADNSRSVLAVAFRAGQDGGKPATTQNFCDSNMTPVVRHPLPMTRKPLHQQPDARSRQPQFPPIPRRRAAAHSARPSPIPPAHRPFGIAMSQFSRIGVDACSTLVDRGAVTRIPRGANRRPP